MGNVDALDVAKKAWDRWVAADLDGFLSLFDAEGAWIIAGQSQIGGTWRGPNEIARAA